VRGGLVVNGQGGRRGHEWHARLGYTVLGLLLFRLVWGFIGGLWSRFRSFLYAPAMSGLPGRPRASRPPRGHNPLGRGFVFAMLLALLAQAGTGLFADDDAWLHRAAQSLRFHARGPGAHLLPPQVGQWLVIGLVLLHIAAIAFYVRRRRQVLVRPMITGDKELAHAAPSARDDFGSRTVAVAVALACAGLVTWIVKLGRPDWKHSAVSGR
jgi:cytochrome b